MMVMKKKEIPLLQEVKKRNKYKKYSIFRNFKSYIEYDVKINYFKLIPKIH